METRDFYGKGIAMKKTNPVYVLTWYGLPILFAVVLAVVGIYIHSAPLFLLALVLLVVTPIAVPGLLKKRMEKYAAELEREFPHISYKFTAHNCVLYLDTEGGHMGVVWRNNPSQLQSIDPMQVTDIRTNTGQKLRGTELVSCQFLLNGSKVKVYTLRVSGGQLAMKDPRVLEAISKADQMGEVLRTVQAQNAHRKG